jgi:hypothetical protein
VEGSGGIKRGTPSADYRAKDRTGAKSREASRKPGLAAADHPAKIGSHQGFPVAGRLEQTIAPVPLKKSDGGRRSRSSQVEKSVETLDSSQESLSKRSRISRSFETSSNCELRLPEMIEWAIILDPGALSAASLDSDPKVNNRFGATREF